MPPRFGTSCPFAGCGRLVTSTASTPFARIQHYAGHVRRTHVLDPRERRLLAEAMGRLERPVDAPAPSAGPRAPAPILALAPVWSHADAQRLYRTRLKARVRALFGGFCYGCGANGRTKLDYAHVVPTGLDGPGRGTEARMLDVLAHPFAYVPFCRACHLAFGGPETERTWT